MGILSHFAAAQGTYLLRPYQPDRPADGTLIVQGTSAVANVVQLLAEFEQRGWNLKVVCAVSAELFARQPQSYQEAVLLAQERLDSTVITTQGRA